MQMEKKWVRRLLVTNGIVLAVVAAPLVYAVTATEAPAGFDNLTNGFESQAQFDLDRANFDSREEIADGLGPIYNAQACAECHQNPVSGATSQITELRVARDDGFGNFSDRPGGSLINDRAINAAIQERVAGADNITALRSSLNILGDGFVEALPDSFFTNTRNAQPSGMKGTIINVPVGEATAGTTRVARFGWKNQHASLLSFAADAYLNEMGITSPLQPTENTSNGVSVAAFDTVARPGGRGARWPIPAAPTSRRSPASCARPRFRRVTRPWRPPRTPSPAPRCSTPSAATSAIRRRPTTAPAGTVINGTTYTVPASIGDKIFHPYSDFMLHDIGQGDGIIQNGGSTSRFKMRTAPLWGMRTRSRLSFDLLDFTRNNAILFHFGEANPSINSYLNLSVTQQNQLITFLNSL